MPQHGATIQSSSPQNIAQATLGLKGGDVPQNILVPDLIGTVELGRRDEPELLFEQDIIGWRVFATQNSGGAGTFASFELLNPEGVISVVWFTPAAIAALTINVCWGEPAAALGNAYPIFPIDSRVARASISSVLPILRSGTPAAAINANILWSCPNTTDLQDFLIGPFILGAQDIGAGQNHLVIECATAATPLALNFVGYSVPRRPK